MMHDHSQQKRIEKRKASGHGGGGCGGGGGGSGGGGGDGGGTSPYKGHALPCPDEIQGQATLEECDGQLTCSLSLCVDAVNDACSVMRARPDVSSRPGRVVGITRSDDDSMWEVAISRHANRGGLPDPDPDLIHARKGVILATGRHPTAPPLDSSDACEVVDMRRVIAPNRTAQLLQADRPDLQSKRWAVVGNSHSGMLVVQNLIGAGVAPGMVTVVKREEMKWAERQPGGWTRYDGTGLKGTVATWAKHDLPPDLNQTYFRGNEVPWEVQLADLGIEAVVFANGFDHGPLGLPSVEMLDRSTVDPTEYDGYTGSIAEPG